MTTAKENQNDNNWFHTQQQFWNQWFEAQGKTLDERLQGANPLHEQWSAFFKEWQNSLRGAESPLPGAEVYQSFFTQAGKEFFDMMQAFQHGAEQKSPQATAHEWADSLQNLFTDMMQSGGKSADAQRHFANWGENMLKAGKAWSSAFQSGGGPFHHSWTSESFDPFGFAASMPGIGYNREQQDSLNDLYKRWNEYDHMLQKYNAAMAGVGVEAARKFQEYLASPPPDAAPLKSLKDIYIKWVDICEDIYARFAMSDDYTVLYGETVNALMAYKKKLNDIGDDIADKFNMPTRREVDGLHERLQKLRQDNRRLRQDVDALMTAMHGSAKKAAPQAAPKQTPPKAAKPAAAKKAAAPKPAKPSKGKKTRTTKGRK